MPKQQIKEKDRKTNNAGETNVIDRISEVQALGVLLTNSFYEISNDNYENHRKVFGFQLLLEDVVDRLTKILDTAT